jgi:hypothetical protein
MHLEYDLILTNVFPTSLTLTSLDVTAADGSVLLHSGGDGLLAKMQPLYGRASDAAPTA